MSIDDIQGTIAAAVADDTGLRLDLPGGGRLFFDRPLPFVCVYRRPASAADDAGEQLVSSQSSYLVTGPGREQRQMCRALLEILASPMVERFGAFFVLEVWETPASPPVDARGQEEESLGIRPPRFEVVLRKQRHHQGMLRALTGALMQVKLHRQSAVVRLRTVSSRLDTRRRPLDLGDLWDGGVYSLGLEVDPIYRDRATMTLYPRMLRVLRRALGRAIQQAMFAFVREATSVQAEHYHALGRRDFVAAVWEVDSRLVEIERAFDLLLLATPINAESSWREFRRSAFQRTPLFRYRPLPIEPLSLKRRLLAIPVEHIEDASVARLLWEKQRELDRRISMLSDIGTGRFVGGSIQVFGGVDRGLLALALRLLETLPVGRKARSERGPIDASTFARRARDEIAAYREQDPGFDAPVEVRDDIYSGLLVSNGRLLIGSRMTAPRARVDALLQHEIGTHVLTFYNGCAQRFRQLATGLAGYDRFQEGLALLAEYFAGGLTAARLRLVAARVVAVDCMLRGATFVETFRRIHHDYGFKSRIAYVMTMRVYRGGGLTKDATYLQGLADVLEYVQDGGLLEPLFVGKIAARHIPLMEEFRLRGVLAPPRLRPRFLDRPDFQHRIDRLRQGVQVEELVRRHV